MIEPVVLLTAFEPFGGEHCNPSLGIAQRLAGESIQGHRVHVQTLPVVFDAVAAVLDTAIARLRPSLVIALGQAGGRSELSLERVAINLIDARIPDNAGMQPIDASVLDDAPAAYFGTLPVKAIVMALRDAGVPAQLSFSAGSFVCNQVFYLLMHRLETSSPQTRGGFIHVPFLPEQAAAHPGAPSMALETMVLGIRCAIETTIATTHDVPVAGGTTC